MLILSNPLTYLPFQKPHSLLSLVFLYINKFDQIFSTYVQSLRCEECFVMWKKLRVLRSEERLIEFLIVDLVEAANAWIRSAFGNVYHLDAKKN